MLLSPNSVYADGAILTFGMQFTGFVVAAVLQTEIFYDVLGGINFLALAVLAFVSGQGTIDAGRNNVFVALFAVSRGWLLLFLAWRAHHRKGDSRFDGVRNVPSTFFVYWMVQAIWVYCISLPLLAVAEHAHDHQTDAAADAGGVDGSFLLLLAMAMSIVAEIHSDVAKAGWVSRGRPGGFCREGLWKHSRHPNYAGEILTWVFAAVYATCVCGWSWKVAAVASVSPLFTVQILLNTSGTGVWNAEGKNLRRYYEDETIAGNYEEYRKTTPPLFPTLFVPYESLPRGFQRRICFEWNRFEYRKPSKEGKEQ
ncbi:unnamed protein product [Pseudo-nitzschia multistriata]|uniref:Uncharacterized protein n=1 Tax=Pseudo-nitzschia multistriata TaxID=183589 RepID=A0A448ZPN2_9STRA|nr:unnamed protein product [Pseudo-nitzschia multistriata]